MRTAPTRDFEPPVSKPPDGLVDRAFDTDCLPFRVRLGYQSDATEALRHVGDGSTVDRLVAIGG